MSMAFVKILNMETREEEVKLEYLVSGSYDALPSSYLKLRSYLNIHSSNLANLHGLKLPKCFTKSNLTCGQCFLPWSCDTSSIKLLPVKKRRKSSTKTKVKCEKADLKSKVPKNHLVLKCTFCNSRSHFYFPKVIKTKEIVVKDEIKIEKKKKKKKKDKTCGLRKTLNTSLKKHESPIKSTNETKSSTIKPSKAATSQVASSNVQKVKSKAKSSHSVQPVKNKKQNIKNKNFNSHSTKTKCKNSKKNKQNLQKLQKIIQREKEPVKKTLKDFLTLV